jgi:hypothetical protein
MSEETRKLPGWLLPVGLAVLVVTLVSIALLRGPVELDPDTPEGTVQEYLLAIDEERWDDAISVIDAGWRGACDGESLSRFSQGEFTAQLGSPQPDGIFGGQGFTVNGDVAIGVEGQELPAADTTVEVTITHDGAGGLGGGWDEYVVFELANEDGFWWIVSDPWPYFIWNCRE